jgi:outer membrane protein assembly factor BamA
MENTFIPDPNNSFNTETPINFREHYAFQTIATNLRGFNQNIRNGTSFALVNTELRFPVFSFLLNTPIRSELIKNFQLIGFFDGGTAWEGFSPYDKNNPFNSIIVNQGPVSVFVNYFREPIVVGYGAGARTTLLGYFVRVDWAQGIDSGAKKKPIWYVSLGSDF